MKRRSFLGAVTAGLAGAAASTVARSASSIATKCGNRTADVVVIGAGAFGAWASYFLQKAGVRVTLVDANGAGNSIGASGGNTRILRADYGDKLLYTRLALQAGTMWQGFKEEWREELLLPSERIKVWPVAELNTAKRQQELLAPFGVRTGILNAAEARKRWPQMIFKDDEIVLVFSGKDGNPPGAGSVLLARRAIGRAIKEFQRLGGTFKQGTALVPDFSAPVKEIALSSGERLSAGTFIFASGYWLREMFPELLAQRCIVKRRFEHYVATPAGGASFDHPHLPIWAMSAPGWYGFPSVEGAGLKLCNSGEDHPNLEGALRFVQERFPKMTQTVVSVRQCHDAYSPDDSYVIDQHPGHCNVWIAGCGSGHGFKLGPVVGEHIAARISGGQVDAELEAITRWKSVS